MVKVLIQGHARHGKDTVAEYLSKTKNLKFESTSLLASKYIIYPQMQNLYKDYKECFEDRLNNRKTWFNLISDYNKDDPARFVKEVLKHNDIYVGLRSEIEFECSKELFDLIIWVEDPRKPKESKKSFNAPKKYDILIDNSSDLNYLYTQVDNILI